MKQFIALFLFITGFQIQVGAQSFLNELKNKKSGEGVITVNQSPEIDELVNNAKLVKTTPAAPKNNAEEVKHVVEHETAHHPEQAKTNIEKNSQRETTYSSSTHESTETAATSSTKKVMRNSRKITGYRIQLYSGGNSREDRQKAERIRNAVKQKFPDIPVYVHFYSPRWICRAGNFRTYKEADIMLKEFKNLGYRQACIVKGKITVGY